jgi:hypothetical protein
MHNQSMPNQDFDDIADEAIRMPHQDLVNMYNFHVWQYDKLSQTDDNPMNGAVWHNLSDVFSEEDFRAFFTIIRT